MGVILGLFIIFALCLFIGNGNWFIAILIFIGLIVYAVLSEKEEDNKKPKKRSVNVELETTVYNGLLHDWNNHKTEGNHFVPEEYVGYMEKNNTAWEFWAKARTNEIMIDKGFMGQNMRCVSEYNHIEHKFIDYTTHESLFEDFNATYLPLIEYYNQTGEVEYSVDSLSYKIKQRREYENSVLRGYELYPSETEKQKKEDEY